MMLNSNFVKHVIYIFSSIFISIYLFYPLLSGTYVYPFAEYELYKSFMINFIETLTHFELPTWNEYVGSGHPAMYYGHYPITQNTIFYMLFGFSDFTYYFTKLVSMAVLIIGFIYAAKLFKFEPLIALLGALAYFCVNFVVRFCVVEGTGANLYSLYPILVMLAVYIVAEYQESKKEILLFILIYIFWLSGAHITFAPMHAVMLSVVYWIAVCVCHGNMIGWESFKKFILLYGYIFIIPCIAVAYQYYFIIDTIRNSNRFKEGMLVSPFIDIAWKQLLLSFNSSSYIWLGLLLLVVYGVLKWFSKKYQILQKPWLMKYTTWRNVLITACFALFFLIIYKKQFVSNSNFFIDYLPILNSYVFRIALLIYIIIKLIVRRHRDLISVRLSDCIIFFIYISLLSYYFYSPDNISGDVNGYDFDLFRELSIPVQTLFTLAILCAITNFRNDKIVKIMILSLIVLYLIRSHLTIPLLRFTGIVWYATRDGSIFSLFFAILFMFGLKNILTSFGSIVERCREGLISLPYHLSRLLSLGLIVGRCRLLEINRIQKIIRYAKYAFLVLLVLLMTQDSYNKFYHGLSHRYIFPNKMSLAKTGWERSVIDSRKEMMALNRLLLEKAKNTPHFFRLFMPENNYITLGGSLQQHKLYESVIYDSTIAKQLQDFYDNTILEKTHSRSTELKDVMPYFLFTRHVHEGIGLQPRDISYDDFFIFSPKNHLENLKNQNIEFFWDLSQVKYLIIGPQFSKALKRFSGYWNNYSLLEKYPKLGLNLYEIKKEKNYSKLAVLPLNDNQSYGEIIERLNSQDVKVLKKLYSQLVFFGEDQNNYKILETQQNGNKKFYKINAERESILIDFESWNHNWTLRVNNKEQKLEKAFQIFKGINISPGVNIIEQNHQVKYFKELFILSIFMILFCAGLLGKLCFSKKKKKQ
jgi:hypothetical protein